MRLAAALTLIALLPLTAGLVLWRMDRLARKHLAGWDREAELEAEREYLAGGEMPSPRGR